MLYHYVLVRGDLTPGQVAAQLVHAAGESARLAAVLPPNTHAVVLQVPDEVTLLEFELTLLKGGYSISSIREPDAPFNGQITAIGIEPQVRNKLRKILGNLPLLR